MGQQQPQNVVTTQNKDPWIGSQGFLTQAMGSAAGLYNSDTGYHPYPGQTQIDPHTIQDISAGIDRSRYLTDQSPFGSANLQQAIGQAGSVIGSQGITPGIAQQIGGLQTNASTLGSLYSDGSASGKFNQIYDDASGQTNPYLQATLDAQGRKIADQVNSAMSGAGRYGSGAHTNVLSRNLAEAADPILAQDYQNRQQTRLAAGQGSLANMGLQSQIAGQIGQNYGQQAGLYGEGLNRMGQFSQLAPSLDAAQFNNIDRSLAMGDYERSYQQSNLNDAISRYNAQEARPWEQIARYNAIIGGSGGLGGSTVTSSPNMNAPVSGLQRGLGGALAGAGIGNAIFPGYGAAIGGLAGGALGFL